MCVSKDTTCHSPFLNTQKLFVWLATIPFLILLQYLSSYCCFILFIFTEHLAFLSAMSWLLSYLISVTGCSALPWVCSRWGMQLWANMQLWSSSGKNELQPICIFSFWHACCSISRGIPFGSLGSICFVSRATALVHCFLQGVCYHPRTPLCFLLIQ